MLIVGTWYDVNFFFTLLSLFSVFDKFGVSHIINNDQTTKNRNLNHKKVLTVTLNTVAILFQIQDLHEIPCKAYMFDKHSSRESDNCYRN